MIDRALVDPNYRPGWYSGSNLNYGSFWHSMSSSFSGSVNSSSTPPSMSGGSGGGGSSGGGGGRWRGGQAPRSPQCFTASCNRMFSRCSESMVLM